MEHLLIAVFSRIFDNKKKRIFKYDWFIAEIYNAGTKSYWVDVGSGKIINIEFQDEDFDLTGYRFIDPRGNGHIITKLIEDRLGLKICNLHIQEEYAHMISHWDHRGNLVTDYRDVEVEDA